MKNKIIIVIIAIIISCMLFSCVTGNNGRSESEIQNEFNQEAIYFIQNNGLKLIEYMDKDTKLSARDKQPTKRRIRNLNSLIEQMNKE